MQITNLPRRHLAPSELVDTSRRCPVCGSGESRPAGLLVQSDPDVYLLTCGTCHAASASHMPSDEVLASYYANFYAGRDQEVTFAAPDRFARHVTALVPSPQFDRPVRVLDFGGGDGRLARTVASRWIAMGRASAADIVVVDFAEHLPRVEGPISMRWLKPDAPLDRQYDLVLASAILEHIPDLASVVRRLHDAIAPRGCFYARTPFALPLGRVFPRLDLGFPAHVHDLGSGFWNRFPATFGWNVEVVASRPSLIAGDLGRDPFRTLVAAALKAPGHLENWLSSRTRAGRAWNFVGGWEVVLRRTDNCLDTSGSRLQHGPVSTP